MMEIDFHKVLSSLSVFINFIHWLDLGLDLINMEC